MKRDFRAYAKDMRWLVALSVLFAFGATNLYAAASKQAEQGQAGEDKRIGMVSEQTATAIIEKGAAYAPIAFLLGTKIGWSVLFGVLTGSITALQLIAILSTTYVGSIVAVSIILVTIVTLFKCAWDYSKKLGGHIASWLGSKDIDPDCVNKLKNIPWDVLGVSRQAVMNTVKALLPSVLLGFAGFVALGFIL